MGELAFAMALGVVLLLVALTVNIATQLVRHSFRGIWAMTSESINPDIILKARGVTLARDGVTLLGQGIGRHCPWAYHASAGS